MRFGNLKFTCIETAQLDSTWRAEGFPHLLIAVTHGAAEISCFVCKSILKTPGDYPQDTKSIWDQFVVSHKECM